MNGIIDADTQISESEAMWAMMDKSMYPRRPLMLSVPEDTSFGNRNAGIGILECWNNGILDRNPATPIPQAVPN